MEIIARLTADAVVKTVKDERQVVNFNVAINDSYKPKGSDQVTKVVTYLQCDYWVNPGIAQYLTKGTVVELYGRIGVNAYTNMQGEAKASLTFHVNNIKLHGGNKGEAKKSAPVAAPVIAGELTEPLDNLPF
ncbi:MAG: single-stranded DNA-binding protein [Chitinophagaceae bacterium]|nr:single-stranded DNA-binding protein [Chitinophagaceae bacterium]